MRNGMGYVTEYVTMVGWTTIALAQSMSENLSRGLYIGKDVDFDFRPSAEVLH